MHVLKRLFGGLRCLARRKTMNTGKFYTKDFLQKLIAQNIASVGDYSYGNVKTLGQESRLTIGKYCSIAENCTIFLGYNHRVDWVTTYPFNVVSRWDLAQKDWGGANITGHPSSKGDVHIGNDVWIGYNVTILSGVNIGDGAVIGANALVTKSVAPYSIVGGNPASLLKYRFDTDTIQRLLEIAWWNWDEDTVKKFVPLLMDGNLEAFFTACNNQKLNAEQ